MQDKKICVIGLGYIGLPTAALLASHGYDVVGVDLNAHAVETINAGRIHIVEPDLDAFVRSAVSAGRLKAYTTPQAGDVYIICVPTPFTEGGAVPKPNIDYVLAATRSIAGLVKAGDLVILESTSPVGTTEEVARALADGGADVSRVHVAYCPERVLPGKIMTELLDNDRVVGGLTPAATEVVGNFYRTFVRGNVLQTEARTAEMCKLTENSFRDVNIAFANELSVICEKEGIDVWELIRLANRHPRVNILQPGAGVGGHCIAVDPWFIVARDPENARLIRTAREVNNDKTAWVVERIKAAADARGGPRRKARVACLGLAFKPDIDDLRESPALSVAQQLHAGGYDVLAVEPNVEAHELPLYKLEEALAMADVVAVLVKHRQFVDARATGVFQRSGVLDFCGALGSGSSTNPRSGT
ncbi:UDP-N-acetyl-D-mannosamine dehydrogenase [Ramlibacter albus]|uniref:UDP-N-acetyl-D-mannosamine dehydrogenase n=1 Tax=Ramlibacter albus TaxID=2079448 RepID=A0A923MD94_9BURK|nr:UDP-N-acetyl-D-mannosamine dehydrogenase [Ramlibacter albus]MBC5766922.1 UDP-N-acetyl-D-mannosamine dehydrogenase [Ramlibacter albus]